eukprot:gene14408-biopygen2072
MSPDGLPTRRPRSSPPLCLRTSAPYSPCPTGARRSARCPATCGHVCCGGHRCSGRSTIFKHLAPPVGRCVPCFGCLEKKPGCSVNPGEPQRSCILPVHSIVS